MIVATVADHEALVASLMSEESWPQGGGRRQRIDTHISTIVLAGEQAYKLKKPLDLGFLDFVELADREHACREELRLNRRLAPQIYEAVCAVTGSIQRPGLDGDGEIIDWAVRMRRFDPDAILSNLADRLDVDLIDALAVRVASFHDEAATCPDDEPYGDAATACAPMFQNLAQIREFAPHEAAGLAPVEAWTRARQAVLTSLLTRRKAEAHVRECHGDLHLGNVALIDGEAVVFDAIEFNPTFRWIDTINDVAFMTMDLQQRGRDDLAFRFLDRYLQQGGDYAALPLLRFYEVYRAMVRAKIAAIRFGQPDLDDAQRPGVAAELSAYLSFAAELTVGRGAGIVIMRGVSGSGKSTVSNVLPGRLHGVRLRSDIERKRLLGIEATQNATAHGAYDADATSRTYGRLRDLAQTVVGAGYVAIVDATFLKAEQRAAFRGLADELGVPFAIVDCDAPVETLRERILARQSAEDNVSDAGLAVLDAQLATAQPLDDDEARFAIRVRPGRPLDLARLEELLQGQRVRDG